MDFFDWVVILIILGVCCNTRDAHHEEVLANQKQIIKNQKIIMENK